MNILALLLLSGLAVQAQIITQTFGSGTNAFSIDFVQIGNPGNAADTTGSPNPAGAVLYAYCLGKYEINRGMIDKANMSAALGIEMNDLSLNGGNGPNKPATGISWYAAAKFINYLNTSSGYSAAYKFDSGGTFQLWSSMDNGFNSNNKYRNSLAKYFLPSSDEWYKGAYGSPDGTWYDYPTGSDIAPTPVASGTSPNTAVYKNPVGPADVTNAGGLSAWGTMAQGGNVFEWNETAFDGTNDSTNEFRIERGADWYYYQWGSGMISSEWGSGDPAYSGNNLGFRVAMIPEPSSLSLLLAGGAVMMAGRGRLVRLS